MIYHSEDAYFQITRKTKPRNKKKQTIVERMPTSMNLGNTGKIMDVRAQEPWT